MHHPSIEFCSSLPLRIFKYLLSSSKYLWTWRSCVFFHNLYTILKKLFLIEFWIFLWLQLPKSLTWCVYVQSYIWSELVLLTSLLIPNAWDFFPTHQPVFFDTRCHLYTVQIQFWHCVPGVTGRPHRVEAQAHRTACLPPTSDVSWKSQAPVRLTRWL